MSVEAGQTWRLWQSGVAFQLFLVTDVEGGRAKLLCLDDGWVGQELVTWMEGQGGDPWFKWERFT